MAQNKIEKWDDVHGSKTSDDRMVAFLESTTDAYALLQMKHIDETERMQFLPYEYLQEHGREPVIDHYEVVYNGTLENAGTPTAQMEELFLKFNLYHPEDFRGHSMSVSDIVALKVAGEVSCYYVDPHEFRKIPDFIEPANYLKTAEMSMEDDYGMIDGIINNGKSAQREDTNKPSVLEQLKITPEKEVSNKPPGRSKERDLE